MAAHSQPSITDIKIKMKVLRNQLVSRIAGINAHAFDPLQFGMYFQRYRTMAVALRHELPSLFGDLPDGIEAVGDDVVKRGAMIPRDLLWELASGRQRQRFVGHESAIQSLAFSPDGRLLAASSTEAPVYVWDLSGP